jgi:hypothetical protein
VHTVHDVHAVHAVHTVHTLIMQSHRLQAAQVTV